MADVLAEIMTLPKFGGGIPLARLQASFEGLWDRLASSGIQVVHVTGSNGKGSTAAFLDHLLRRQGLRTGLFTSPHYFRFNERFQLDGACVADAALQQAWHRFREGAGDLARFGGFEAMTVMAADLFVRSRIDVAIVEAGIGGRYDPTRMFRGRLGLLTSIDLEHVQVLGATAEEIAADKLDLVMPGGTVITGWLDRDLHDFCKTYVSLSGRDLVDASVELEIEPAIRSDGLRAIAWSPAAFGNGRPVEFRIPARYFVRNSILGLRAAELVLRNRGGDSSALFEAFVRLCAEFELPGRLERVLSEPPVFCDVAHTPDAIRDVVESCKLLFRTQKPVFVAGMSVDKDYREMCRILAAYGSDFLVFSAAHKGEPAETLAALLRDANPAARVQLFDSAVAAADFVRTGPLAARRTFVATGGLFSAIEFRTALRGEDVSSLCFY